MKKLFIVTLIALFAMTGVSLAASPTLTKSGDVMGQNKYVYDSHRVFRLVHVSPDVNDANGIAAGSVVVWDDYLDDGVSVETTTTSGDSRVAGVLVTDTVSNDTGASAHTASEDVGLNANWGWLQTYGLYQSATASANGITVGDAICAGPTAGTVSSYKVVAATYAVGILGSALDAAAASATLDIFITCD